MGGRRLRGKSRGPSCSLGMMAVVARHRCFQESRARKGFASSSDRWRSAPHRRATYRPFLITLASTAFRSRDADRNPASSLELGVCLSPALYHTLLYALRQLVRSTKPSIGTERPSPPKTSGPSSCTPLSAGFKCPGASPSRPQIQRLSGHPDHASVRVLSIHRRCSESSLR